MGNHLFLFKNFLLDKNYLMRKEDVYNFKTTILNRVRFHAPICYDSEIDRTILFNNGVNLNYPIFVYRNTLSKEVLKAFYEASLEADFNLLIPLSNVQSKQEKVLKKINNCVLFGDNAPLSFITMINKLNINYPASCNYDLTYKEKFFKVNNEILNPVYKEFSLQREVVVDSVQVEYKEFLLNGNNIYVKLKNNEKREKKLKISLNFPLKRGYFLFKRLNRCVKIENLQNGELMYFSFICPCAKMSFSAVDGLENSSYSTIYLEFNLTIKPNEKKSLFFLMSNKKFPLKTDKEFDELFEIALNKSKEIFDLKVKTKDAKFDQFFNNTLPKKIWLNWSNFCEDESLLKKYETLRRLFIKGKDKICFVPFKEIGLKELGIFNGEYYKKILISFGDERYLQVGKTKFFNISNINKKSLSKRDAIFLSFA